LAGFAVTFVFLIDCTENELGIWKREGRGGERDEICSLLTIELPPYKSQTCILGRRREQVCFPAERYSHHASLKIEKGAKGEGGKGERGVGEEKGRRRKGKEEEGEGGGKRRKEEGKKGKGKKGTN